MSYNRKIIKKFESEETVEETYASQSSIFSEKSTQSSPTKIKQTKILASAIKSFKKLRFKNNKLNMQPEEKLDKKSNASGKKKSKTSSLVKKFTNLKKSKISPKKDTKLDDKRHTPEGAYLSLSETSLVEMDEENEEEVTSDLPTIKLNDTNLEENKSISIGEDDQITNKNQGLIENVKQESISSIKTFVKKESLKSRFIKKIQITESNKDKSPTDVAPTIPYKISEAEISSILESQSFGSSGALMHMIAHSSDSSVKSTGAIKKYKREEVFDVYDFKKKSESKEFFDENRVIATIKVQESKNPFHLGNSLNNPNLSSFKSLEDTTPPVIDELNRPEIKFDIGTPVRPPVPLSNFNLLPSVDLSSTETIGSLSPTQRRRIKFVAQPSFYTEEEKLVLEGKEPLSHLSGISEYSLASNCSFTDKMAPIGDLLTDKSMTNIMTSSSPEKREYLYKILVIGELGTGKTSFIRRYVHQFFSQNYRATIGVDFALKVLNWDQNTIIRLQLWDIAGQERFGNMTRVYYKEAAGAFIVFDVTRSATFDAVIKWKQDLDSKVQLPDGSPIPCILLANKCDQPKQGIVSHDAKMDEYVKENGFAGWFQTSAKENVNIEDAAKALVNKILLNDNLINSGVVLDNEKIALDGQNDENSKSKCAC